MSTFKLPKTWAGLQRRIKRQREQKALEAIICGVMRGFTRKGWQRVFDRVDELKRKRLENNQHQDRNSGNIY